MVPAALGSETGGSVRQPASFCGVVGVKPTYGRVSRYGLVAFGSSLDCVSVFGRTVSDAEQVLAVIGGLDPLDATTVDRPPLVPESPPASLAGITVGIPLEYFPADLHPGVKAGCEAAIATLKELGARVVGVSLPHAKYAVPTYYIIAPAEAAANLARFDGARYGARQAADGDVRALYRATRGKGFGAEVRRRILVGTYVLRAGYTTRTTTGPRRRAPHHRGLYKAFVSGVNYLFTPTTPTPAFKAARRPTIRGEYLADISSARPTGGPAGREHPDRRSEAAGGRPAHGAAVRRGRHAGDRRRAGASSRRDRRGRSMSWETVIGLEVHVQLGTARRCFAVLYLVRRPAQHHVCRSVSVCQRAPGA